MKTLQESILSRSSHGAEGFKNQIRNEIEEWLNEYKIKNYTINDDLTIDVNGDVDLTQFDFENFPDYIQFGVVNGFFDCSFCHLKSLRGAPKITKGSFDCSHNELVSLEEVPEVIKGDFYCDHNNSLNSLKGAPKEVGRNFYCYNCACKFTEDDVKKISNVKKNIIC